MSILKTIKNVFTRKSQAANLQDYRQQYQPILFPFGGLSTADFARPDFTEFLERGYGRNPFVYQCVEYIADILSTLPYNIVTPAGDILEGQQIAQLTDLLNQPNATDSRPEFIHKICTNLKVTGNAFIWGVRPVGLSQYSQLNVLYTPLVEVNTVDGTIGGVPDSYSFTDAGKSFTVPATDVLHIMYPNIVRESNFGLSPLHAAIMVYEASNDVFEAEAYLHKNRGISGILSNKDANFPMLPEQQSQVQKDWDLRTSGAKRFGKIHVTNAALDYLSMSMTPTELKMIETSISKLRTICSIYGLSSALFNDPENKTYNNAFEARLSSYNEVILPTAKEIFQPLSKWLIQDNFRLNAGLSIDQSQISILNKPNKDKSDKITQELNAGIISQEQAFSMLYPDGIEVNEAIKGDETAAREGDVLEEEPQADDANALAQANLRGSVGGVQGILQIQSSVASGVTSESSAIATLIEIYGFDEQTAKTILGI